MLEFNFVYGDMGYEICRDLRQEVFGEDCFDDRESVSYHFVGYDKLVQIGVARLTKLTEKIYEISFVAVKDGYRRQFVGDLIMRALQDKAYNLGALETVVKAPVELKTFFEFEYYRAEGDEFSENGKKYIKMTNDLTVKHECRGCKQ